MADSADKGKIVDLQEGYVPPKLPVNLGHVPPQAPVCQEERGTVPPKPPATKGTQPPAKPNGNSPGGK